MRSRATWQSTIVDCFATLAMTGVCGLLRCARNDEGKAREDGVVFRGYNSMKRFFTFFFYLLIFSAVFAETKKEEKDYLSFRITPEIGILNGSVKEFVFDTACQNKNHKESELDWDVKNIIQFGISGDFDILDYVYAGVNFCIAAPGSSGYMQDYDWLNSVGTTVGYPKWENDDPYELTNYSKHDNRLEKCLSISAGIGGNIFLPKDFKITPFAAYSYDYIGFSGSDGFSSYKSDNFSEQQFSGKVISYRQESNAILLGIKVQTTCVPKTFMSAEFCFSPALTFTNAMDYHLRNGDALAPFGKAYWDKLENIWQLRAGTRAQFIFNQNHSAGLSAKIQYIPLQKGKNYSKPLAKNEVPEKGKWIENAEISGGVQRLLWSVSLNYSFSL